MKKLRKLLIGLGILGVFALVAEYKINKMKPEPQFLEQTINKEILEVKLIDSFDEVEDGLSVVRYDTGKAKFAILANLDNNNLSVRDIKTDANSLGDLIESGILENIVNKQEGYLGEIKQITLNQLVSPITSPKNIIGLAYNYFEHAKEVGESEEFKGKNLVAFRKETNSLCGPFQDIAKPNEVKLLDYEVELGLVIGKRINKDSIITQDNYRDFIAGYVLTNDMSARDVQLKGGTLFDKAKGFRKGKSYDNFCPVGPVFLYSSKNIDFELEQYLVRENKSYRLQEGNSSKMINSPYDILKELQRRLNSNKEKEFRAFIDEKGNRNYFLEVGDLILTGTPAGVAFNFSVKYVIACRGKKGFINFEEKNNEKYLKREDLLITQSTGLGYQKHSIKQ